MAKYKKQFGMSLTEILVVVSIMAILMGISIPAAKQLMHSFESSAGVRHLINAALSNARAIAVREQTYAGVRFQEDAEGHAYITFIVHDPDPSPDGTGLAYGFRAVMGRRPMKMPEDVGVLSGYWVDRTSFYPNNWNNLVPTALSDAALIDSPANMVQVGGISRNRYLMDASTFSVIFSPQGKLTVHPVWVRNKDGQTDASSNDTIFNVENASSVMFLQDDYGNSPDYGIGPENSVQSFLIYKKPDLNSVPVNLRWTNYLSTLQPEFVSPYTGELVMEYREQKP